MNFEKEKLKQYLGEKIYKILKKHRCIIAGGFIRNIITNTEVNDVDIYFRSKKDLKSLLLDDLYSHYILSCSKKTIMFEMDNIKLQFIHINFYENAEQIFENFDFTCCMGAYDFETEEFVFHKDFLLHNCQRILQFNTKTLYPIISALRVNKYIDRGYKISKKEFIKIMLTINTLNINSLEEFKEQLGGMYGEDIDTAFSKELEENFDLTKAIEEIEKHKCIYSETKEPVEVEDYECFIELLFENKIKYCKFLGNYYANIGDKITKINCPNMEDDRFIEVAISKIIKFPMTVYKIVEKKDNKYFSYHDSSFEYKIKEYAYPKLENKGLYVLFKEDIPSHCFYHNKNKAVLKCKIESEEDIISFMGYGGTIKVKKLYVIKEEKIKDSDINE